MTIQRSAGAAAVLIAAALTMAGATSARATCGDGKVLFSDEFKQVDSSWGFDSPDVQVEDGKVKVKPQPDISNLLVYKAILFKNADFCMTVRTPNKIGDNDNTMAGPIFWAKDYDNYYMFMITPSGYAELTRKVEGKWIAVVEWKQASGIKGGQGANNLVEVRTEGNDITASINGSVFATVKGQAPEGGGQIGMRAQSEKEQVDTWKFSNLVVTAVGTDAPAAPTGPAPETVAPKAPATPGTTTTTP